MLTDVQVRKAKPAEAPFKLADAGGLHLYVTPAGGKLWRYRCRVDGKEKLLSLGAYPALSLAEARQARDKAKADQRDGRDPAIVKRQARHRATLENAETFEVVAREWHELQKPVWSKHHAWDVLNSLETDVFPVIGRLPIRQVTSPDVLHLVRKVERRGAIETGRRIRQRVSAVFDYAISTSRAIAETTWLQDGFTAVLVTHDVSEAVALADRLIVIEKGTIALDLALDFPRRERRGSAKAAALERRVLDHLLGSPQP